MSIEKKTYIDKIEIIEGGFVQIREATVILEDGNELSRNFHRTSLFPGQSLENQPDLIKKICELIRTNEVIAAYAKRQSEGFSNVN